MIELFSTKEKSQSRKEVNMYRGEAARILALLKMQESEDNQAPAPAGTRLGTSNNDEPVVPVKVESVPPAAEVDQDDAVVQGQILLNMLRM